MKLKFNLQEIKTSTKVTIGIILSIILFCLFVVLIRFSNEKRYAYDYQQSKFSLESLDESPMEDEIEGVKIKRVVTDKLKLFHLTPPVKTRKGVLVSYSASEPNLAFSYSLSMAKAGYETLVVSLYRGTEKEKRLGVPLENFDYVLDYVEDNIGKSTISVLGESKGAGYVLNLASKYSQIKNVILVSPTYFNLTTERKFDFTWRGKGLSSLDVTEFPFWISLTKVLIPSLLNEPISFREIIYSTIMNDGGRIKDKKIPVEDVKAKIMMLVGEDDHMINTVNMANLIKNKRELTRPEGSEKNDVIIHSYKNAGHIFHGNGVINKVRTGGTLEGNSQAEVQSTIDIQNFLDENHQVIEREVSDKK